MNAYPSRVDRNQKEIVAALRSAGAAVQHLHTIGHGCPDLLVCYRKQLYLIEVKAPGGRLTPDEQQFIANWPAAVSVVHSTAEALEAIGAMEYRVERTNG